MTTDRDRLRQSLDDLLWAYLRAFRIPQLVEWLARKVER